MPGDATRDAMTAVEFAQRLDSARRSSMKSYRQLALECGLGFNTIAGYCSGRHLPQLAVSAEFRLLLAAMGVAAGAQQDAWLADLAAIRSKAGQSAALKPNPYRGLRAFQPADAAVYFGRRDLVSRLVHEVAEHRFRRAPLVVVGPSGSGKSSLLRAGLIPAVTSSALMTPGADPLRRWDLATASIKPDTVVVIDQFEELFTLCADWREREAFLAALAAHSGPTVIGLRADYYGPALRHQLLARLMGTAQIIVEPLTESQLREVIIEPARVAGLELDSGLVELLIRDSAGDAGALPLLSHTLHTIVETARQSDPPSAAITVALYQAAGGVQGAIAQTAELAYQSLGPAQRTAARNLFLRLVKTDVGAVDTRRHVTFDELFDGRSGTESDDLAEVVDVFIDHRLLTASANTVEIGHEALLGAWPRLNDWLTDDRAGHLVHGRLTAAARRWRDEGRQNDDLYHGGALATAREWASAPGPSDALNPLEREFLDACAQAQSARAAIERRRVRRGYQALCAVLVLLLATASAGLLARQARKAAADAAQTSLSRQTAATADRLRPKDPALAAQLAMAAYRISPTPEARAALLDSSANPMPRRMTATQATATVLAHAGTLMVVGTDTGHVQLSTDVPGRAPVRTGPDLTVGRPITALAISGDGTTIAASGADGPVTAWRVDDPARPIPLRLPVPAHPSRVYSLAFDHDATLLAAGTDNKDADLWRLGSQASVSELTGPKAAVKSVAFAPDGHLLAAGSDDDTVHLWDTSSAATPALATLRGPTSQIFAVALSPDGRTLAAGAAAEHAVYTWDVTDPRRPQALGTPLTGPASWINTLAFSPDGSTIAAGSSDTLLWRWDLRTRRSIGTLPQPTPVVGVVYQDDQDVATLATDGMVRMWNLPGPILTGTTEQVFSVAFSTQVPTLLIGDGGGALHLWNLADPLHPVPEGPPLTAGSPATVLDGASAITPDGTIVIGGAADGSISLWNVADPAHPVGLGARTTIAHAQIEAVSVSPDGRTAAASSDDGTIHVLDISDPRRPTVLSTLTGSATGIAFGVRFSPDGQLLAGTGADAKGYLWDVRDRRHPRLLTTVTGFKGAVYSVAFSSDGALLAFGGADYSVRLVDLTHRGAPAPIAAPLRGPTGEIYELGFAPGRAVLAVSSVDGTIWLWDLSHPRAPARLATLQAAGGGLLTIAFAHDGRTLAGGGSASTVQLWNTDPDFVSAWICANAGEPITTAEWTQFVPGRTYAPPCR